MTPVELFREELEARFEHMIEFGETRSAMFPKMGAIKAGDFVDSEYPEQSPSINIHCPEIRINRYSGTGSTEELALKDLKQKLEEAEGFQTSNFLLLRAAPETHHVKDALRNTEYWVAEARLGFTNIPKNP